TAPAPPDISTLSLHDALPISAVRPEGKEIRQPVFAAEGVGDGEEARRQDADLHKGGDAAGLAVGGEVISDAGEARHRHDQRHVGDRKSTRLNSSHVAISYAVF